MKRSLLMLSVLAALPSGYAYRSDTPMIMPDMSYLDELQRYNRYEDSLDIIDGDGSRFVDCSQVIKRFEQEDASCGTDYTGTITKTRKVYGTGTVLVRAGGRSSSGIPMGGNIPLNGGVRVQGLSTGDIEAACLTTPDGYTSQWQETSNSCVYTPLCNAAYDEEITGTCPDGYTGTLTKTVSYRSKYFGQNVSPSQCNSGYQEHNTTTYDNCKPDVPPTIEDERIVKDSTCNERVAINGEKGKWVKFTRGGKAFWLPMYSEYIEQYGVKDFYEKIYNAYDKGLVESEYNNCIILTDNYKNQQYDSVFEITIDGQESRPIQSDNSFNIYRNAEYNIIANNINFFNFLNMHEKDHITLSGDYIKINGIHALSNNLNSVTFNYSGDMSFSNVFKSSHRSFLMSTGLTAVFNFNANNFNVLTQDGLVFDLHSANLTGTQYRFRNVNFNINNEIYAPKLKTGLRIGELNAKKATFYEINDLKSYMDKPENRKDLTWNVNNLIAENEIVIPGEVTFNGNITSLKSRVVNYKSINGNICLMSDEGFFDNFGKHTGDENFCKNNNGLEYIPHEYCNSTISINGEKGKWVTFKQGGNAFWLPMYSDYISQYGKSDFYDKVYNSIDRNRIESSYKDCIFLADEYKNSNYDDEFLISINANDNQIFTLYKSAQYNINAEGIRSINRDYRTTEDIVLSGSYMNLNNVENLANRNINNDLTLDYKENIFVKKLKRYLSESGATIKSKNLIVETANNQLLQLNNAGTLNFHIKNELNAPRLKTNNSIGRLNAQKAIFYTMDEKKSYNGFPKRLTAWNVNELISEEDVVIKGGIEFNGNITSKNGRIFNYQKINGNTCFLSNNGYLDNFGVHNGSNVCKDNNGLEFVPNDFCNNSVSINGESGKWVTFKQGGSAFWLPMYSEYLSKHNKSDLYEKIYNSIDRKILELNYENCYILDDDYKDSIYDGLVSLKIIGESEINKKEVFVRKNSEYNFDLTNVSTIMSSYNYAYWEKTNVTLTGDYIKMDKFDSLLTASTASTFNLYYNGDITLSNMTGNQLIGPSSTIIKANNLFINNVVRSVNLGSGKQKQISLMLQNELNAPKLALNVSLNDFNAKKALVDSLEDQKSYEKGNIDIRNWNVDKLETVSNKELSIRGTVRFTGDIKTPGRVFIYGETIGDIYITDEGAIIDEFSKHTGEIFNYNDPGYWSSK